jgi:non-canonical (house-cleaning) NTP pyrophosphatase
MKVHVGSKNKTKVDAVAKALAGSEKFKHAELLELWLDANAPDEIEERPTKQVLQSTYKIMLEAVDKERNGKLDNHFISR